MCIIDESERGWHWPLQTQILMSSQEDHVNQPIVKFNFSQASSSGSLHPTRQICTDIQTLWRDKNKMMFKFIPAKLLH